MCGSCSNRCNRSSCPAKARARAAMASALGPDRSRDSVDCAAGTCDGYALSARLARDRKRITSRASVLLGTERNHVRHRISNDSVCGADGWVSGGDVDGQRMLSSGGAGVAKSVSGDGEELGMIFCTFAEAVHELV